MPQFLNIVAPLPDINPLWVTLAIIWTFAWKGMALWRASGLKQKGWFVAILLLNTLGILDIIYLYIITRKRQVEN